MSEEKTNAGQGLGIAGFVLGLIALIISFIPCLGMYALVPGIPAIVLSAIGLSQANKGNGAKGLIIAAIVISIIGTIIAGVWGVIAITATSATESYVDALENFDDEFKNAMEDIEEDGTLDASVLVSGTNDIDKYIDEEDYDKVIDIYEETVDKYIDNLKNMSEGDLSNLGENMAAVTMVTAVTLKVATASPFFSDEQRERFDAIQKKYDDMEKE